MSAGVKFYEWIQAMQNGHTMSPKEFEVAVMTASYCTGETGNDIRPGAPRIAKAVNWKNPHRVYPLLKSVVEKGYLELVEKGGKGKATEYRLALPVPPVPYREDDHRNSEGHRNSDNQSGGTTSPDRVDHLATNTYIAYDEEKEEDRSSNFNTSEANFKFDPDTGEITSDSWDDQIAAAGDDIEKLTEVGKALVAERPDDPRLPELRRRVSAPAPQEYDYTPEIFQKLKEMRAA